MGDPTRVGDDDSPPDQVAFGYDHNSGKLIGTVGDRPVDWETDPGYQVSGRLDGVKFSVSWTTGSKRRVVDPGEWTPTPQGGWLPAPDDEPDSQNTPAELTGTLAALDVELHGEFRRSSAGAFKRGSIVGKIGSTRLEAIVSGPRKQTYPRIVKVKGTYGTARLKISATIDASSGSVRGEVDKNPVHLDFIRPLVARQGRTPRHQIDVPGPHVVVTGRYQGPLELLALVVGAMLQWVW